MEDIKDFKWTDELVKEYLSSFFMSDPSHPYQKQQMEDFKKSKEKDIPKEWEILSLINTSQHIIFKKWGENRFSEKEHSYGYPLDELLRLSHFSIHSVKRLSDGEVFTVGDKFNADGASNITISGMVLMDDKVISIHASEIGHRYWLLGNIEKVKPKEPLLTCVDGIEVFNKEQIIHGFSNGYEVYNSLSAKTVIENDMSLGWKWFSTKEARNSFVLLNKPIEVSLSKIKNIIDKNWSALDTSRTTVISIDTAITEFFISKINP